MAAINDYNTLKSIIDSGDTSSPEYWAARENYEDTLHFTCGLTLASAQAFAATMQEPYEFNVAAYRI